VEYSFGVIRVTAGSKLAFKATHPTLNGNGNGHAKLRNAMAEAGGFGFAEAASEGTWMGIALVAGFIPKSIMDGICKPVGKLAILPVLDPLERLMARFCKLEECQPDLTKPREERAANLAKTMLVYGLGIWTSLKVKLHVRRWTNVKMGIIPDEISHPMTPLAKKFDKFFTFLLGEKHVSPQEKLIFAFDEIPHYGSMILLNNQLAPATDSMIRVTSNLLQKTGLSEEKAQEYATAINAYGVPNVIGAAGGMAAIAGKHLGNWPKGWVGRLLGSAEDATKNIGILNGK